MEKIFIKNTIEIDVDSIRGVNTYTINAMYDVVQEDGYGTIEHEPVDKIEYTWSDIEKDGGIAKINEELKEAYGLE